MSTISTFGPPLIGQTEKALNAILDRELAGTGLTERQWVTLTLTVIGGASVDRDQLVGRVVAALKVREAEAQALVAELAAAQLLQASDDEASPVTVTDTGQQLHGRIRSAVTEITQRLWGDLPGEDLATAGRVLNTVLARANAELAGGPLASALTKGGPVASTPEQVQNIPLDDLRARLEGELITADAPSYDEARQVFFKGVDKRPLAVARVAGADDVAAVVNAAREAGLELAVRSGGHSRPGYGTVDGGLVIDLSGMDGVEIDADARAAWVETGAKAGKYTLATSEKGRVTGLGDTGSVGIGGITLAGGIGFLVRKTGLTIDNLLAAEVVTADGEVVQASEDSEPDLFWAIRGGEGNFGVATRLQLRLAEISEIVGGMLILPASPEVITGFLDAANAAADELSTIANVMLAPPLPFVPSEAHGKPVVMGQFAYVGPVDRGEAVIAPFRALARPLADIVRPMRYPELYEGPGPEVCFAAGTNYFAESLEPADAEAIIEHLRRSTAPMSAVQLRVLGGALARVPNGATAFAHRDRGLFVNVAAMYADGGEKDTHDAWVNSVASSLGKDGSGGYVGFLGEEDEATIRAAYPGATWDRLRDLKRRYDPENLFRLNHNIPPAEG